ncbi:MAG: serine/threonine protein kinase [Muribaculaceae bacterium]|nr:serine/threonine protein kinase [Muribaculaceae bacterium]
MINTSALSPGTVLQSPTRAYTIQAVLGQGGFGITYSATYFDIVDGEMTMMFAAVKEHFISSLSMRDPQTSQVINSTAVAGRVEASLKDFTSEARRLNSLRGANPNIVDVIDVFTANNTAYYVMEHLGNNNLRDYVKSRGTLTLSDTYTLMRPIIEAVAYLHESQITHLDIKPANIMLAGRHDGTTRPVLIDFGLSKHYNDDGNATSTINIQGFSDGYAPLEQYGGISKFSPQSDVYALAANIIYCLTGHTPPKATDLDSDKAINAIIPRAIPAKVRAVLVKALQNSRALRYDNARLLLRDLDKAINNPKSSASNTTVNTTKSTHSSRHILVIALSIIVLALIGMGGFYIYKHFNSSASSLTSDDSSSPSSSNNNSSLTYATAFGTGNNGFIVADDGTCIFYDEVNNVPYPAGVGQWEDYTDGHGTKIYFNAQNAGNRNNRYFHGNQIYNIEGSLSNNTIYLSCNSNNGKIANYVNQINTLPMLGSIQISSILSKTTWKCEQLDTTFTFYTTYFGTFDYRGRLIRFNYLVIGDVMSLSSENNYYHGNITDTDIGATLTLHSQNNQLTLKRIE